MNPIINIFAPLLIGATFIVAPIIPVGELIPLGASLHLCSEPEETPALYVGGEMKFPTTTLPRPSPCKDTFSVAAFTDQVGNRYFQVIENDLFAKMTEKDGAKHNPKKEEMRALIDLVFTPVEAAIVLGSENVYAPCGGSATGITATCSFNNVAGNFVAFNMVSYTTDPGVATATYNGVSMTQLGSNQGGGSAYMVAFYLESAPTGANNLVINTTNSLTNGYYSHAVSYSGTALTAAVANVTQQITGNIGNDSIATTVGDTANSFVVWFLGSTVGRTYTAGVDTRKLTSASDSQGTTFDSNGIASADPWTLNATIAGGTEIKLDTSFELKVSTPSAAESTNSQWWN